jgi:hypothetical protein
MTEELDDPQDEPPRRRRMDLPELLIGVVVGVLLFQWLG